MSEIVELASRRLSHGWTEAEKTACRRWFEKAGGDVFLDDANEPEFVSEGPTRKGGFWAKHVAGARLDHACGASFRPFINCNPERGWYVSLFAEGCLDDSLRDDAPAAPTLLEALAEADRKFFDPERPFDWLRAFLKQTREPA
jgi:hypothetical protein